MFVANMLRIVVAILMAITIAGIASCAHEPDATDPLRLDQGQVFLYLSCSRSPAVDVVFSLSGMAFLNDMGEWVEAPLKKTVHSADVCGGQMKLSQFYLPEGKYRQMKWTITDARVQRDEEAFSLALPEPGGEHLLDIAFAVFRGESTALFVDWDPEASIFNQYLFKPETAVRREGIEIKKILAYVTNTDSDALTVIERQRDAVVAVIAVGHKPKGVVVNADGTNVYVANSGSNSISVVDTDARKVVNTISNFGYSPAELVLSTDEQHLYAVNPDSDNVSVIDTVSETVCGRVTVGFRPAAITYDGNRGKIYVANQGDNTVSVIDAGTASEEFAVTVGLQPTGLAVEGSRLYVANSGSNTISVIQLGSYAVVKTVDVGPMPMKALSGLSGWIYVTHGDSNEVSLYYTSMDMITKNIFVGNLPTHMAMDALRRKLYVVNSLSDTVSVLDLATKKVVGTIEVGRKPYGIASAVE